MEWAGRDDNTPYPVVDSDFDVLLQQGDGRLDRLEAPVQRTAVDVVDWWV